MTTIVMQPLSAAMQHVGGRRIPKFQTRQRASLSDVAEAIGRRCSLTAHDVKACISALSEVVGDFLGRGYAVSLGELGTLRATPQLATTAAPETSISSLRNAPSFTLGRILFTPAQPLQQHAGECFARSAVRSRVVAQPSTQRSAPDTRLRLLQDYLRQHQHISATRYAALTGLSRSTAYRELRRWQREAGNHIGTRMIDSRGRVQTVWED